jgi:sugar transferase (PEP-CTERM/EpsH1 system associated)
MAEILFLAHRIPFPPNRGDKIRSWHLLREIARWARVHLACFADDQEDAAHLAGLRAALGGQLGDARVEVRSVSRPAAALRALRTGRPMSLTAFESAGLQQFVAAKLPAVDAVYAFSGQMAQFVPARAAPRFVMDFVDVDSAKFAAYAEEARGPMRFVYAREAKKLLAYEADVASRADASLFVSEAEAALFRRRTRAAGVRALANGIDSDFFDPGAGFPSVPAEQRGEGPLLLFTGQMDYRPNVDAVRWFATEVLPLLPGARFAIAGRNPAPEVLALADPRVKVTGAVDDMRSWLAAADAVVAPLRIARGVQNKVLEAMAMERPVVASPAAFEGIEAEPGRHLLVADGPIATAEAVKGLLSDPARARELGRAARRLVATTCRWEARLAPLRELLLPAERAPAADPAPSLAAARC